VIGGEGKTVQIDESHIHTRKYHRGRFLKNERKQIWVFGGIEKNSNNCLITIVQKTDKDTHLPLIKKFILPGTKIITNGWKAYNTLEQEGYIHGIVNHSIEFVNSDDLATNTQKIERLWKSLKNGLKRERRAGDDDDMHIFQFINLHQQSNKGNKIPQAIFPHFLQDITAVYPRYGKQGLWTLDYS
jgi:hypothetical protein